MPPAVKTESAPEVVERIQRIEDRSDKCYKELSLLELPWNLAAWAALTDAIRMVEVTVPPNLYGSRHHINVVTNASMTACQVYKFTRQHACAEIVDFSRFQWNLRTAIQARQAFEVANGYASFCVTFPYWHENQIAAELSDERTVRFVSGASSIARRIRAYQQGIRPRGYVGDDENTMENTPTLQSLFDRSLRAAQQNSTYGVYFPNLRNLQQALYEEQSKRTLAMMRHYPDIQIGDYSLEDFRKFYSGVNALAGAHEFLCYLWSRDHYLPLDSLLLFDHRYHWVQSISRLTELAEEQVYAMLRDVVFGRVRAVDFHLLPLVPLNTSGAVLALAPFCSLSANWEENLLRCLSRRDTDLYSTHSVTKEDQMRRPLVALTSGTRLITGDHKLPKRVGNIDLIVQDLDEKVLVFCELKWIRKPSGPKDRETRDAEVLKGFEQIARLKRFVATNPEYLFKQGYIAWRISHFTLIHYCVVARDHFLEPPESSVPLYSYDAFAAELKRNSSTTGALRFLQSMDWLPVEGVDFRVQFDRHYAGGVAIESEVYYPAGAPMVAK